MLLCFLLSGLILAGDDSEEVPLSVGEVPQGLVLSSLLFKIYMRLLGGLFYHHEVKYHQYTDDTQLHISTSGEFSNDLDILFQYLEAVRVWLGE